MFLLLLLSALYKRKREKNTHIHTHAFMWYNFPFFDQPSSFLCYEMNDNKVYVCVYIEHALSTTIQHKRNRNKREKNWCVCAMCKRA